MLRIGLTTAAAARTSLHHPRHPVALALSLRGLSNDNNNNNRKGKPMSLRRPDSVSNDNNNSSGDSGWVVVDNDDTNDNMILKELNIVEPIELIAGGLPPKELKLAQKQAQKALQEYINIANKATILLSTLQKQQQAEAQ